MLARNDPIKWQAPNMNSQRKDFVDFFFQSEEDVVKLTVIVRGIPRRKVYGHALLQLRHLSDPLFANSSQDVELIIYSSVSDQLVSIRYMGTQSWAQTSSVQYSQNVSERLYVQGFLLI